MSNIELDVTPKGSADLNTLPKGNVLLDSLPKGCVPMEVPPTSQFAIYLDGVKDVYNKAVEFSETVQDVEGLANEARESARQIELAKEDIAQNTALSGQHLSDIIGKAEEVDTNTTTVVNKANEVATNTAHVDEYYNKIKDIIPEGYAELVAEVDTKADKSYVDDELAKKANSANVYTKDEADAKYLTEHQDISGKADKATTLAGYGIDNAYTKIEVNTALSNKVDINTYNTKMTNLDNSILDLNNDKINKTTYNNDMSSVNNKLAKCIYVQDRHLYLD